MTSGPPRAEARDLHRSGRGPPGRDQTGICRRRVLLAALPPGYPAQGIFPFPGPMKRQIVMLGLVGGLLIAFLKWIEYRFLVLEHSFAIYGGLIAATFAGLGIWLGLKFLRPRAAVVVKEVRVAAEGPFRLDEDRRRQLNITPRELEILGLIAQGLSNREIAERLFVSENTVKTHSSRVFDKLGARRRTQAVQRGKEYGLLP
jgi:NarL family two-component system response regulator LiaR